MRNKGQKGLIREIRKGLWRLANNNNHRRSLHAWRLTPFHLQSRAQTDP